MFHLHLTQTTFKSSITVARPLRGQDIRLTYVPVNFRTRFPPGRGGGAGDARATRITLEPNADPWKWRSLNCFGWGLVRSPLFLPFKICVIFSLTCPAAEPSCVTYCSPAIDEQWDILLTLSDLTHVIMHTASLFPYLRKYSNRDWPPYINSCFQDISI